MPVKTDTSRKRVCALDLGSRNFKAVLGFRNGGSVVWRLLSKHTMHLGKEIADNGGVIGSAKLAEVRDALEALVDVCRKEGASTTLGIATRAVREARNGADVVDLAVALGIDVEIADGPREAAVGYLAATGGAAHRLVSDFGSLSLQIAWRLAGAPLETGYVACGYEDAYTGHLHGAPDFAAARRSLVGFLGDNLPPLPPSEQLIRLNANTMACYVTGKEKSEITGRPLERDALTSRIRALEALSGPDYRALLEELPRARKVLPGLILVDYLLEHTGHSQALIAEAELPAGLIVEHFLIDGRAVEAGDLTPTGI